MNLNISTGTVFDRVALVCGAISICIGGMGLAGWAFGLRVLAGVRLDYIPMVPNTALIVILLGCALFSGIAWPGNRTIRMAIAGVSFFCIPVAGLTLIGIVTGIDLKIDYLLLTTTGTIGAVPVGRMSPVTAICVLLGCAALLLLLFRKRDLSALLGTVIALVGGVMIIGYWYGAPLLYGGTVIPVALTTAVALGVLGVGLNAAAGPESWPLSSVTGASTRARLLRGLLPVILLLVLIVNWINAVISGPADSSIVLSSAVTGILSLLVVYVVVTYLSREIGDAIDRSEEKRKKAEGALHESEEKYRVSYEQLAITEEELRQQYSVLAEKDEAIEALNQDLEKRVEERTSELRKTNEDLLNTQKELRKQFEELAKRDKLLSVSEERFRISAQSVSDVIWDWSIPDGRLEWYGRIDEILGYAPGEFPRTIDALEKSIHPDDRDQVMSMLDRYVKTRTPYAAEYRVIRKDGEIRYWTDRGTAMLDDQGRAYRMVGSCSDINGRKIAEEERARLASIVEYSEDAIIGKTLDGIITSWNAGAERIFGYPAQEMVGKSISLLVPPDHPDDTGLIFERIRNGEPVIRYETLRRKKDGGMINVSLTASQIRDAQNRLIGVSTIAHDITKRKLAEEALRQKNEELDGYFTNTLDLLCIADTDGYFRRLNREWESALGYSLAELEGKRFLDFVHPDDMEATLGTISELSAGKKVLQFTNRYRHKDGSYRWIEWRSFPAGNLIYASARDITERKKMTEQIEASLAEKETLLKEIHHRVKNNLQIIASLLNLQIRKITDPTTIETLIDCQSRVRSMALVHEHLYRGKDFSHIDLGNYIRALGTVLFKSSEAGNRGVQFDLSIRDIYVDTNTAIPLGLISNELITNSLKYAFREKKGGKLSITATEDHATLTFVMADNGVGISPDITLENQTTLGLQLVSTLTDQLNGTVAIDRTEGTKFTFTFPKQSEQKPSEEGSR